MSIIRFSLDNGNIYMHEWDDVEYVNPREYLLLQNSQAFIIKYLNSIEKSLGKCPQWLFKSLERIHYNRAMKFILHIITSTYSVEPFNRIINEDLRKSQQELLLKGVSLSPKMIMSLIIYAGSKGYLLSHYSYRESTNKGAPYVAFKRENGEIVSSNTSMSDKELNYHIENDELTNAYILSKGPKWFCLCQRKKGIHGKEPGKHGGTPHIHFISSAYSVDIEKIVTSLKMGRLPYNSFHINLSEYI